MKQILIIVLLLLFITSTVITQEIIIVIKDRTLYDPEFIASLADYNLPLQFIDNYILSEGDTTFFPDELPLLKKITFYGQKSKKVYLLTLTRISLTNLNYDFTLSDKSGQIIESKSGTAILGSMFFLAPEGDEDNETGEGYTSNEYWDKKNNCWFSVRVGLNPDGKGEQRAKVTYGCIDNTKSLTVDECPVLKTRVAESLR